MNRLSTSLSCILLIGTRSDDSTVWEADTAAVWILVCRGEQKLELAGTVKQSQ